MFATMWSMTLGVYLLQANGGAHLAGYLFYEPVGNPKSLKQKVTPYVAREGDLIFYDEHSLVWNLLFAWAGTGPPLHMGIVVKDPQGMLAVLEAGPDDTVWVKLLALVPRLRQFHKDFQGTITIRRCKVALSRARSAALTKFAQAQNGKPYAVLRLLLQGTPFRARGMLEPYLAKTYLDRDAWICSELAVAAGTVAGLFDPRVVRANATYPLDLVDNRGYDLSPFWHDPAEWGSAINRAEQHKPPPLPHLPFSSDRARALQAEWAKGLGLGAEVTNSIGMKLALIPGGRFDMGPNGSKHRVTLTKPFYIGVTEVTLGQYRQFKADHKVPGSAAEFNADDRPAAFVSWKEASAYCTWLSRQPAEKKAGRVYALPTEAQWEWAARAGTTASRHFADTDKGQADYSWFNFTYTPNPKSEAKGRGRQPVARLKPNAWGLHDMLGNVWEWCADMRVDEKTGERRDPVMRGGSWRSGAFHCTSVAHDPGDPNLRADNIGFRVVCRIAGKPRIILATFSSN